MGYDAIRDVLSSNDPIPSPTNSSKRGIAILLNEDPVLPSPSSSKRPPRYDPIHHPDLRSPVEMATSSASSYFMFGQHEETLPGATTSFALNTKPQDILLSSHAKRDTTGSPTISTGTLPSISFSPQTSPSQLQSRPTSSSMPPPASVSIPYNPRNRISPPGSVLSPLSPDELHDLARSHRNPLRKSALTVNQPDQISLATTPSLDDLQKQEEEPQAAWSPSRPTEFPDMPTQPSGGMNVSPIRGTKRPAEPVDDADWGRPSKRRNEKLVAQHYNARPEVGKEEREHSPIIGLKSFNNWIKAVMIAKFARPAIRDTNSRPEEVKLFGTKRRPKYIARVLDVGCGKGGDLAKWAKAEIAQYVGVDIADVSIEQARSRWVEQRRKAFDAEFFTLDCYTVCQYNHPGSSTKTLVYQYPLDSKLPPGSLRPFDVVSMQFCMHYAFETEEKVRMMLHNVTAYLRPGGVFIGTIPNSRSLL